MATFTNTGSKTVKVMYKVAGVQYYIGTEADPAGRPFDEVVVAPGATVELGDVTWQKTVELADVQTAVVRVGPQRGAAQDIVNRVVDANGDIGPASREFAQTFVNAFVDWVRRFKQ